jgi:DNA-binding transcriptional MerR regulator
MENGTLRLVPMADPAHAAPQEQDELTIDELAREAGMTARNIRAYQSRGLLPPPRVRARTGYYGREHVARLRLIQEMQGEGFNLRAIERLLEGSRGSAEEALGFKRSVLSPFGDEQPEFIELAELEERLGGPFDEKTLAKAERLGLLRPLGEGRFEVPSPTLLRAGEELFSLGIPLSHALAVAERIYRHSRAIAEAFVELFVRDVVGPVQKGPGTPEDWARVQHALERLRPLATEALVAGFQQTMTQSVERSFGRMLER